MNCIVTGHTNGIGKAIYNYLISKGYTVKGMSRSNGYDIIKDFEKIINESNCDLFVNCACDGDGQLQLLNALHQKVKNMIVLGSVSADYSRLCLEYENKANLEKRCKEIHKLPDSCNLLFLKLSFCENATLPVFVQNEYITSFLEIIQVIDLWFTIPKIGSVEFVLKETLELKKFTEGYYNVKV